MLRAPERAPGPTAAARFIDEFMNYNLNPYSNPFVETYLHHELLSILADYLGSSFRFVTIASLTEGLY